MSSQQSLPKIGDIVTVDIRPNIQQGKLKRPQVMTGKVLSHGYYDDMPWFQISVYDHPFCSPLTLAYHGNPHHCWSLFSHNHCIEFGMMQGGVVWNIHPDS